MKRACKTDVTHKTHEHHSGVDNDDDDGEEVKVAEGEIPKQTVKSAQKVTKKLAEEVPLERWNIHHGARYVAINAAHKRYAVLEEKDVPRVMKVAMRESNKELSEDKLLKRVSALRTGVKAENIS